MVTRLQVATEISLFFGIAPAFADIRPYWLCAFRVSDGPWIGLPPNNFEVLRRS